MPFGPTMTPELASFLQGSRWAITCYHLRCLSPFPQRKQRLHLGAPVKGGGLFPASSTRSPFLFCGDGSHRLKFGHCVSAYVECRASVCPSAEHRVALSHVLGHFDAPWNDHVEGTVRIILLDTKVDVKIKLAGIWTSVMFCIFMPTIFGLYVPGRLQQMLAGTM